MDIDTKKTRNMCSKQLLAAALVASLLAAPGTWAQSVNEWVYTVKPGDSLWDLGEAYLSDMRYWRRVQAHNKIRNPKQLVPGSKLRIPTRWLRGLPATATVLEVDGDALVTSANGNTASLAPNTTLYNGDVIKTSANSNLKIEFSDGSVLFLRSNSELKINSLVQYEKTGGAGDTMLELEQGRINTRANPRKISGTRYEINTPAAVAAVRGTEYRLSVDPKTTVTRAEVIEGEVALSGMGRAQSLNVGYGTSVVPGEPPQAARRLPAAPNAATLPAEITRLPVRFDLTSLSPAHRLQLGEDETFNKLIFEGVSSGKVLVGPKHLEDGQYIARIRAIDESGLEGLDVTHRFTVNAVPESPFVLSPQMESVVRGETVTFEWAMPDDAQSFHLQLASTEVFVQPVLNNPDIDQAKFTSDPLQPGVYYWRVATRDKNDDLGPFGDAIQFELKPIPTTPELEPPAVSESEMGFRWSEGLPGQQFQFQIARDREFGNMVADITTPESAVTFPRPKSGFHYLRIRTIDADGYVGEFGPAQKIDVPPTSYLPYGAMAILIMVLAL